MKQFRILIVDDNESLNEALSMYLRTKGYTVDTVRSAEDALLHVKEMEYQLIISDVKMPGMNGIELLKRLRSLDISTDVILITGHSTIDDAIKAIKSGAEDYLSKPLMMSELERKVQRIREHYELRYKADLLKQNMSRQSGTLMIGESPNMVKLRRLIKSVADSKASVLIQGESGTGKELIARSIHEQSPQAEGQFIAVNCAAIPASLLESELFGHEKGAFTGASERKYGLFELADRGTLFLDEIGDLPAELQSKLLRTIEVRSIRRLGGAEEINVDFRLLTAANRDIAALAEKNKFRSDLFYRISTITITADPLRKRKQDIEALALYFLNNFRPGAPDSITVKPEFIEALKHYNWPGNVRELKNIIERALIISTDGTLGVEQLPRTIRKGVNSRAAEYRNELKTLKEVETEHILRTMDRYGNDKKKAADILGISLKTLYNKLSKMGNL